MFTYNISSWTCTTSTFLRKLLKAGIGFCKVFNSLDKVYYTQSHSNFNGQVNSEQFIPYLTLLSIIPSGPSNSVNLYPSPRNEIIRGHLHL
jgi:hypothetical protein